ncbi:MAG: insulinase family protein, partial [Chloroflexi bacterium]|nr:insulinase family protein [Chloroflexota bacterium]
PHQVVVRGPWFTDQTTLLVGARTVGRTHPDRWALEVLAQMLDQELTQEIRYRRGLVYGLGAGNAWFDDTGYLVIQTTSAADNWTTIEQAIAEAIAAIQQGEVAADRVTDAQALLQGRWALDMEDNMARASWLAQWPAVLADDEPVPDYPAGIAAVTPADLTRVVETYFTPPRRYVGLHQPVLTVDSGARLAAVVLAGVAGLGAAVGVWGLRRRRRRAAG